MLKKITLILSLFLIVSSLASAQTGKIMGEVKDFQTKDALIGANVVVIGTSMGANTGVDGSFIIQQVPPGIYSIKATYIGYQAVTVGNIKVTSGLSAEVKFELPSADIVTKEVVIISKRPLIEKSATNAVRIVSSEDIASLPTRDIDDIVGLQAGVIRQDGNTYIRGSRTDETGYIVAGAAVKDIINRESGSIITTIPDALQDIQVQTGGFSSEFGNASAGIVIQDFKTGASKYKFSVRAETDNFGNYPGEKFLGTYSYGYSDYTLTAGGPITEKIRFFVSGQNVFTRDETPIFFDGNPLAYGDGSLWDTTKVYDTGVAGGSKSDYQILKWGGGNIPGRMNNTYTMNGTLLFDYKPLIVRVAGTFSTKERQNSGNNIFNLFNTGRLAMNESSNALVDVKATYFFSNNVWGEASVNYLDRRTKGYDPLMKDDFMSYSDSLANSQYGYKWQSYTTGLPGYDFYGFPFNREGTLLSGYNKSNWTSLSGNFFLSAQLKKHELKLGFSYQQFTIRNYSIGFGSASGVLNAARSNPDKARNNSQFDLLIRGQVLTGMNNYGYDVFGKEVDDGIFAPRKPLQIGTYLQDKIEIEDLIINAGLRFDYFDMDNYALVDYYNPTYDNVNWIIPADQLTEAKTFTYLQPRLGLSFPVTDNTVFHMQAGLFVQMPALGDAYKGLIYQAYILKGGNAFGFPTGYDLEPIETTQYEVGFSQMISDFAAFDLTAYYKNVKGQLQYIFQSTESGSLVDPYPRYINQDFSDTKGLEMSINIRRIERLRAQFNYSFSDARGTGSTPNSSYGASNTGNPLPTIIMSVNFDVAHKGNINLDYRWDKNDGGPILERLGVNLLFRFSSGHPYTQLASVGLGQNSAWTGGILNTDDSRANKPIEPINSSYTPWNYYLDLRVDKTFNVGPFDVNVYFYVQNLLNTKNVTNVYFATGDANNDGFLNSSDADIILANSRYTERFADLYQAINLTNRQSQFDNNHVDLYGSPRQMRLGVLVNF